MPFSTGTEISLKLTYTFDAKDRLIQDETSGTLEHNFTYTYDSRDNILTSSEEGEVVVQTYDAASRLIDRTTNTSSESYTYDANGNMIWLNADGIESAYTWNKENMLVNVVYKGSPATDAEFTYNAFNQKVLESVSSAPEDIVLAWDGGQYLGSTPVGTDLKTARLNVDGVAIAELVDSDIRVDYLVDALGSVTGVTNASGSVKRDARYSPYGTLLSGNQFEWGWTGNTGSRHTGVPYAEQYNWNRHYSSRTKQWISRDILWPNELAYGYVIGNPVTFIDRTGARPQYPWDPNPKPVKEPVPVSKIPLPPPYFGPPSLPYFGPPSPLPYTQPPYNSKGPIPKYWPKDVDVEKNCCIAAGHWNIDIIWFYSMFDTGRPWDYKQRSVNYPVIGSDNPLADFGNWHFGVMAKCMGFTYEAAIAWAGAGQWLSDLRTRKKNKFRGWPYLMDPEEDTKQVINGYVFAELYLGEIISRCKNCPVPPVLAGQHNPPSNLPVRPSPNPTGLPGDWWRKPTSPIYY